MRKFAWLVCGALFAQNSGDLVVRIDVQLVQVDAVVVDGKNRPVTNLTASDFEIRQDGKLQAIKNFAYIGAANRSPGARPAKDGPLAPVDLKADDVRRTFAIVVDDLGMAWENFPAVKLALRKFVEEDRQANDLMAILPTGGGMGFLQQFTTDPKLLQAAIDHLKHNLLFSRVGMESFAHVDPHAPPTPPLFSLASRRQTIRSLQAVLRGLRALPGRKVLVLISEDLPAMGDDFVRNVGDEANRASVVIYGVDPRGLPTLQVTAADNVPARQATQVPFTRSFAYTNSQTGLSYLSSQTGGLFLRDTNDLNAEMAQVSADSSGYYLIGYQPDDKTFTTAHQQSVFHKLELRVKRKGLHVRSRAGFFSFPSPLPGEARVPLRLKTRQGQIENAFSSPFSSDAIHLRLTGRFVRTPEQGSTIEGLLYIDAKDLKFSEQADGTRLAHVELVSQLAGGDADKTDYHSNIVTIQFKPEAYQAAMKNGITSVIYRQVSKPGSYDLKVVLRDADSEEIGSANQFLEVPDLSRKELALSGIVMGGGNVDTRPEQSAAAQVVQSDPGADPSVRIFPRGGSVLFGYQILNARTNEQKQPDLTLQARLFHDGKEVYAGTPAPFNSSGQKDVANLEAESRLTLGPELQAGDYVLQVVVMDNLAPKKTATASQVIDFEIRP